MRQFPFYGFPDKLKKSPLLEKCGLTVKYGIVRERNGNGHPLSRNFAEWAGEQKATSRH